MQNYFIKLKQNLELNSSFNDLIQTRHSSVRDIFNEKTKLIGSLQRNTRIQPKPDGDFDIDILVILGGFNRWVNDGSGISPENAINQIHKNVCESDRYVKKDPEKDDPTVVLHFANKIKVELVPTYIDNVGFDPTGKTHTPKERGYWVPKNGSWELADYDYDAEYITKINKENDEYLVPIIKMLKAIKRENFPELSSFHLEILASIHIPTIISYKKEFREIINYEEIILFFFALAVRELEKPLKILGSNTPSYTLTNSELLELTTTFNNIINKIREIHRSSSQEQKIKLWKELFGDVFPSSL